MNLKKLLLYVLLSALMPTSFVPILWAGGPCEVFNSETPIPVELLRRAALKGILKNENPDHLQWIADKISQMSPNSKSVQEIFEGVPGFTAPPSIFRNYVDLLGRDPRLPSLILNQSIGGYEPREMIRVPSGYSVELPSGDYSFVLLSSGEAMFGRVTDGWELGVKHGLLAGGRESVAAGEVRVQPDGSYDFNFLSGSISIHILKELSARSSLKDAYTRIVLAVGQQMTNVFGKPGRYTEDKLLPQDPPSLAEILRHCQETLFLHYNSAICEEAHRLSKTKDRK